MDEEVKEEQIFPRIHRAPSVPDKGNSETGRMGAKTSVTYNRGPGLNLVKNLDRDRINPSVHQKESDEFKNKRTSRSKNRSIPKTRSLSPNFWGKGKPSPSKLRGYYPYHVRETIDPEGVDKEMYSGVVSVDFRGRLDVLCAVGSNVARSTSKGPGMGNTIIPGRIIGQKILSKNPLCIVYEAVYLNGIRETLNEDGLRRESNIFSTASSYNEEPLKPLLVRMT